MNPQNALLAALFGQVEEPYPSLPYQGFLRTPVRPTGPVEALRPSPLDVMQLRAINERGKPAMPKKAFSPIGPLPELPDDELLDYIRLPQARLTRQF